MPDPESNTSSSDNVPTPTHILLLLHGIRDIATWQGEVSQWIEESVGIKCIWVRYGWYGPLSFLSPFDLGGRAYSKVHKRYRECKQDYPHAKLSVVAHSFGCHLLGRLLSENPSVMLHRIILCGSVLSREFDWRKYRDRFGAEIAETDYAVLNECGNRDAWPVIAEHLNGRYGASGAYGFESPHRIADRDSEGGHGLFFLRDHVETNWIPFLTEGTLPPSTAIKRKPKLVEKILLSIPFARQVVRIWVAIVWLVLWTWWLWIALLACYFIWCAVFLCEPSICDGRLPPIDYSIPADIPLINPSSHPRFPDRRQATEHDPRFRPDEVLLQWRNDTNIDLWILLFDVSHFYQFGGNPWIAMQAERQSESEGVSGWGSKSGWYEIYLFHPEFTEPKWIGLANLRDSRLTWLDIRCANGDLGADIRM